MKKLTMFLLYAIILSSLCVSSCSKENSKADTSTNESKNETNVSESENEIDSRLKISDDLPEKDFGGYEFKIFIEEHPESKSRKCILSDELDGEGINDAVYSANRTVEGRFNVKLKEVLYKDRNLIKSSIMAGDDSFDIVTGHDISMGNMSLDNLFLNLYDIPHLNFEKPWWPKNSVNSLTVNNKMFLFSNSLSYQSLDFTRALFVNKDKMKDYNLEVPYQDVLKGNWTLDKLISLTKDTYQDINGNSERDVKDFYGYVTSTSYYCYLESLGINVVVKDSKDVLKYDINNTKTYTMLEKLYSLLFESKGGYVVEIYEGDGSFKDMFMNNNAMFIFCELNEAITNLRKTNINYGILPMPKLDESQKEYISGCTDRPFAIPTTAKNVDIIGTIIEAMSAEGYKQVNPAYYEIALKQKFTYDDESAQMLDIINDTRVLDFTYIYSNYDGFSWMLNKLFTLKSPTKDFASYYEKNIATQQKRLDTIIEMYQTP